MVATRHAGPDASGKAVAVAVPTNSGVTFFGHDPSEYGASVIASVPTEMTNGLVLHLEIVTADTGKPIPMVPIDFRGWADESLMGKNPYIRPLWRCDVIYPTNITELELTTRKDDFADTRLLWRPPDRRNHSHQLRFARGSPECHRRKRRGYRWQTRCRRKSWLESPG